MEKDGCVMRNSSYPSRQRHKRNQLLSRHLLLLTDNNSITHLFPSPQPILGDIILTLDVTDNWHLGLKGWYGRRDDLSQLQDNDEWQRIQRAESDFKWRLQRLHQLTGGMRLSPGLFVLLWLIEWPSLRHLCATMEAIANVEKEIDRVLTRFGSLDNHTQETLTQTICKLQELKQSLQDLSKWLCLLSFTFTLREAWPLLFVVFFTLTLEVSHDAPLTEIQQECLQDEVKKVREIISRIASEHRDLHGTVSKVGKAIDKNFVSDFASVANETLYDEPDKAKILNQAIVEHFLRQGMLEIAEELIHEAKLDIPSEAKNPFTELNHILDALKNKQLGPALEWAKRNREKLYEQSSSLEFKLHRLQFISLLVEGKCREMDLIRYARENLQPLAIRHEKDVQSLMGSLLYLKSGLENTAYAYFLDPVNWGEICDVFTHDACALLGLSVESPLAVAFDAGTIALPALLNIRKRMQERQVNTIWTSKDELPIEIPFPKGKKQFHSIFACPILRQQSSDSNPPMRLVCGHVISRDALNKLSNGSKVKCPYCPMESNISEARQIYFWGRYSDLFVNHAVFRLFLDCDVILRHDTSYHFYTQFNVYSCLSEGWISMKDGRND